MEEHVRAEEQNHPDVEWVRRAQRKEQAGSDWLLAKYVRAVRLFIQSRGFSPDRADDIAQEVWLKVFRDLHTLRDPTRFGGWLYGIVRTQIAEARRQQSSLLDRFVSD